MSVINMLQHFLKKNCAVKREENETNSVQLNK
jgi:hypothetical protein